jgi:hypothetical protein
MGRPDHRGGKEVPVRALILSIVALLLEIARNFK